MAAETANLTTEKQHSGLILENRRKVETRKFLGIESLDFLFVNFNEEKGSISGPKEFQLCDLNHVAPTYSEMLLTSSTCKCHCSSTLLPYLLSNCTGWK